MLTTKQCEILSKIFARSWASYRITEFNYTIYVTTLRYLSRRVQLKTRFFTSTVLKSVPNVNLAQLTFATIYTRYSKFTLTQPVFFARHTFCISLLDHTLSSLNEAAVFQHVVENIALKFQISISTSIHYVYFQNIVCLTWFKNFFFT